MAAAAAEPATLYIGLMSGTSLDGVDGVLVDFGGAQPQVRAHHHCSYPAALRDALSALLASGTDEIERAGRAANAVADVYADCVAELLAAGGCRPGAVAAIGAHGQTVRHRPADGFSLQLNAPARLAERSRIDVVADFRARDLAAGGQGAPLAPAFHAAVFAAAQPRVVVNIGGIGNITYLRDGEIALGFDCGPGNALLDLHVQRHRGVPLDAGGAFAREGRVDAALLARLLAEPYLAVAPPKSTGRELFSAAWLERALAGSAAAPADVQRTLVEFTARSISTAIARWCAAAADVVVCGGGGRNDVLMAALRDAVAPRPVLPSDALGVPLDQVEALAFAWLARRCLRRETGSLPAVTGARGARVLGAIYPH